MVDIEALNPNESFTDWDMLSDDDFAAMHNLNIMDMHISPAATYNLTTELPF